MLHQFLRLIPHHLFSSFIAIFGHSKFEPIKRTIINRFINAYDVDLNDASRENPEDYESFVDFFTRELKPTARAVDNSPGAIVSPVDGTISEVGAIKEGQLIQAKNQYYHVDDLLGQTAASLLNGWFATIYLAPRDYHRIHAPIVGELIRTTAIPGRLFSVNDDSAQTIPNLFCRNERLVCWLNDETCAIATVFVGAMIVSSIETTWQDGPKSPFRRKLTQSPKNITFQIGEEMARFTLGSMVIVLFPANVADFLDLKPGDTLRMGERIGTMRGRSETT